MAGSPGMSVNKTSPAMSQRRSSSLKSQQGNINNAPQQNWTEQFDFDKFIETNEAKQNNLQPTDNGLWSGFGVHGDIVHQHDFTNYPPLDDAAPVAPYFQSSDPWQLNGIGADTFTGLDDSARRESIQLLTSGMRFSIPHSDFQFMDPQLFPSSYCPEQIQYQAYNIPQVDYSYQPFEGVPNAMPTNPTLFTAADSVPQQHSDGQHISQLNKRKRVDSHDDDHIQSSPKQLRTSRTHSGEDPANTPSYTTSRSPRYSSSSALSYGNRKRHHDYLRVNRQANFSKRFSGIPSYNSEKPQLDNTKHWVRTNATTKGLTTRTGKINNYKAPYKMQDHPIGNWGNFKYTDNGEIAAKTLSAKQIYDFIMKYPRNSSKGHKLILWIQNTPTDSARRYLSESWSCCRFEGCPNRNKAYQDRPKGSIIHGHYRVAFDEKWHLYRENADPFLPSFYVHLYCMERFLDFPFIVQNADVRPDTRTFQREPKGRWTCSLNEQACWGILKDFLDYAQKKRTNELPEFANYPAHDRSIRGERQEKKFHKCTLTYWMNYFQRELRPPAQIEQFGGRKFKPSNVIIHNGDLEMIFWDKKHGPQAGKKNRKRRVVNDDDDDDEDEEDDGLLLPKRYRNDPQLVTIFNELMDLYDRKMGNRKRRNPDIPRPVQKNRRLFNVKDTINADADGESDDELPQYDPNGAGNNSDADEDFSGHRQTSESYASRRSKRIQDRENDGKILNFEEPQTPSLFVPELALSTSSFDVDTAQADLEAWLSQAPKEIPDDILGEFQLTHEQIDDLDEYDLSALLRRRISSGLSSPLFTPERLASIMRRASHLKPQSPVSLSPSSKEKLSVSIGGTTA
ncbi:hypothetical protein B0J11DRAFT_603596 [Dendryphion nanum]|uniref:Uncharacterized protein n=1 Tax=Dendryphion nanum TaxID=256645 RepID=A0A9P9E0G3_9PLEO|nr:hypothetical protein B0J11DRAFT_603596 [Dendryphion nanum]